MLLDAQGEAVARRDLLPVEYAVGARRMIAPGARLTAEFSARDPGLKVVGFELDACLPRADRAPVCTNDPGRRP